MAGRARVRLVTRRYQKKGIEEMRAIAVANLGDKAILGEILHELDNFRRTQGAKKLAEDIRRGDVDDTSVKRRSAARSPRAGEADTQPTFDGCPDLRGRYDLLLATFSERGEILARWGMTDALPSDMTEKVAQMWAMRVTEDEDHAGRSRRKLSMDMEYLEVPFSLPTMSRRETNA